MQELDEEIGKELRESQRALDRIDIERAAALRRRRTAALHAVKARWTQERIGTELDKEQQTVSRIIRGQEET